MRFSFKSPVGKAVLVTGIALGLGAAPAFALFGLGDIVFDPTSYGELVAQVSQMASVVTTDLNTLNQIKASAVSFASNFKNNWQTILRPMTSVNVGNQFGETSGLTVALNTNSATAANSGWTNSTLAVSSTATNMLSSQSAGNSASLSQLAMIETSDAASPDCIAAVGAYRQQRSDSSSANLNLQSMQFDGSDGSNSNTQQLNELNAAQSQLLTEQQAQGQMHACLAEQTMVQNMQQRNSAAEDLNLWGFVENQQATTNNMDQSTTDTWTTFIP